jgi:hypothetical protein
MAKQVPPRHFGATELRTLAEMRRSEALALYEKDLFSGAYYLAGYAIELALKACICRMFNAEAIPDKGFVNSIYTHRLTDLIEIANMKKLVENNKKDTTFEAFWGVVVNWSSEARYEIITQKQCAAMIAAAFHEKGGIYPWIKSHWN